MAEKRMIPRILRGPTLLLMLPGNHAVQALQGTVMLSRLLAVNEHPLERVLRVVLGLGLLAIVFVGPKSAWGWLGLVPLATGVLGSCPLYTLFGLSTCPLAARRSGG